MITTREEMQMARENIIRVSRELHEIGLLVRTWGNISQRVDEKSFIDREEHTSELQSR